MIDKINKERRCLRNTISCLSQKMNSSVASGKMTPTALSIIFLQFGLSIQICPECVCCKDGQHLCDLDKNCPNGCTAGYFGEQCTQECPENCQTCESENKCTKCKPGYYTTKCNIPCGQGCLNYTCSITGGCPCKSADFSKGKCNTCLGDKYGDECNNTCPINCVSCISDTYCSICKNNAYYGSYCQYICPHGCDKGECYNENGHCNRGCKLKFTGDKCDTCSSGLYGKYCDLKCPGNCSVCTTESNCTQCNNGFYGETCKDVCPSGCNGSCSFTDGRCFVCKPGLTGDFCNKTCENGTYGVNCSNLCRNIEANCQACSTNESGSYTDCIKCDSGYYPVTPYGKNQSICTHCKYNCKEKVCNDTGVCTLGCVHGKWGERCAKSCTKNCEKCSQMEGKCLECTRNTFSDDCIRTCSTNCNDTDDGRVCTSNTGMCLHGCKSFTRYGDYCEKQCSDICNNGKCDWKTGQCLEGCKMNYYGLFCNDSCAETCKLNESTRICDDVNGHCFYGCTDGFHGNRCENRCSSQCQNTTCNQVTAECMHGCIEGYEGVKCSKAIQEDNKLLITISTAAGVGLVVIILLVIIACCLVKRKRRQRPPTDKTCTGNENTQNMQMSAINYEEIESASTYAEPLEPKKQLDGGAKTVYDTTYEDQQNVPDNSSEYAVVNNEKFIKEPKVFTEEVYDTTHDKKDNRPLKGSNEYAVLSVRSNKPAEVGNQSGTFSEGRDDVYDTTGENQNKAILHSFSDYASYDGKLRGNSKTDSADAVYDTTGDGTDKKNVPINNDYDVFSTDSKQI